MARVGDLTSDRVDTSSTIDYLSRDFGSFRRLMLDRLASVAPGAATGNPADLGTVITELLAYAADQVSYYQDAVATEAYLGTARLRTSVRRHARMLDYPMHDGCNARAWVAIVVTASATGKVLPTGTVLFTRATGQPAILSAELVAEVRATRAQGFETMHDLLLRSAHNQIELAKSAGDLTSGATAATLRNDREELALRVGDVLIFEEQPASADAASDPTRRHAVRLTTVDSTVDTMTHLPVVKVGWDTLDALPFVLPRVHTRAVGNVVLADHGYTLPTEESLYLEQTLRQGAGAGYGRPLLREGPLTWELRIVSAGRPQTFDPDAAASAAFPVALAPGTLLRPAIALTDAAARPWTARNDLLSSGPHACDFVVEVEDSGATYLRFGDDTYGSVPQGVLFARYRVGNGRTGNVGPEAIYHIASTMPGLVSARNPLPAQGAIDPEPLDQVRRRAPHYFHQQERAVTVQDYATLAQRFPEVRDTQVYRRFNGSFFTTVITVRRAGGLPVDADFKHRLREFLERFRMAGHSLEINGPVAVPIEIELWIGVTPGYFRSTVLADVKAALGTGITAGRRGYFHPDNFAMGQPLYASQLISAAMQVKGVGQVQLNRFRRYGSLDPEVAGAPPAGPTSDLAGLFQGGGVITMRRFEVPQLDNLTDAPAQGTLKILIGAQT